MACGSVCIIMHSLPVFFNCSHSGGMRILQTLQTVASLKLRRPYIETKVNDHCWVGNVGSIHLKNPFVKLNTESLYEMEYFVKAVVRWLVKIYSYYGGGHNGSKCCWAIVDDGCILKRNNLKTHISWHDLDSCFFTFIEKWRLEKPRNRHWVELR